MSRNLLDAMWPVALERDIRPASLVRGALADLALVIWRGDDGQIHVWEDNCPHRSIRLSSGRNLGDCIEGIYHGWRFGKDGRVAFIPAEQGRPLPDAGARVLACTVVSGLVWAGIGATPLASNINIARGETLIRPLPFRANAEEVVAACAELPELRVIATPTGEASCTVYGFATHRGSEDEIETTRRANIALTQLRRQLEAVS